MKIFQSHTILYTENWLQFTLRCTDFISALNTHTHTHGRSHSNNKSEHILHIVIGEVISKGTTPQHLC